MCVLKRMRELGRTNFVDGEAEEDELGEGLATQPENGDTTPESAVDGVVGIECGVEEEEGLGTQPSTTQAAGDCNNTLDLGQVGEDVEEMGVGEEGADGPVVTDLVDADNGFNRLNRYAMQKRQTKPNRRARPHNCVLALRQGLRVASRAC